MFVIINYLNDLFYSFSLSTVYVLVSSIGCHRCFEQESGCQFSILFFLLPLISRNAFISAFQYKSKAKKKNERNIKLLWRLLFEYNSGSYRNICTDFSGVFLFFVWRIIQISGFITYSNLMWCRQMIIIQSINSSHLDIVFYSLIETGLRIWSSSKIVFEI